MPIERIALPELWVNLKEKSDDCILQKPAREDSQHRWKIFFQLAER